MGIKIATILKKAHLVRCAFFVRCARLLPNAYKEISVVLKINSSAVQKHLEKLKNEGAILREGSDKKGSWKVIAS